MCDSDSLQSCHGHITMNAEVKREITKQQRVLKKRIVVEGDDNSEEEISPKIIKAEHVAVLSEDWNPSKDPEFNSNSFDEEDEEYDAKPKSTKKKKRYLQRYSAKYESNPMFRGWVKASSRGSSYAYCIPCGTHLKITSGKTDLKKHSEMRKHRANVKSSQGGENCITAIVLGEEQPIAKVEMPIVVKDSKDPRKKRYYQRYSHTFEDDPLLQGWVTASAKGDCYAHCIPCDVDLKITAGKIDLKRHAKNKKHVNARTEYEQRLLSKSGESEQCITAYLPEQEYSVEDMDLHMNTVQIRTSMDELEDIQKVPMTLEINSFSKSQVRKRNKEDASLLASRIQEAHLQIAEFIAKHNLCVDTSNHLIQLIKSICPDSGVAQNLECDGADMMLLINNVIGKERSEEVLQLLRDNKFSLILDESSEKGSEKHLIMAVRVLHNYSIIDAFLALIPMTEATVDSLYNDLIEFFTKSLIPYKKNMIGVGVDGGSVLLGHHHSLSSLLKEDIPHLFVMKCIPHSFSLCSSSACLKLPQSLEDLVRDIYSYFQFTPNHIDLEEFEAFITTKPHKLLHPEQARWLSAHVVVSKILEKYDSLKAFFTDACLVDKLEAPDTILQRLNIPVTKLYFMFLDFILPIFDNLDRHMQSESTQIHVLHNAVGMSLKAIFECYLNDDYVKTTPLESINYKDEANFKSMEEMYLGIKVHMEITHTASILGDEDLREFRTNSLEFLIESVCQIYERYSYGCHVLNSLENLNPKVVIEKHVPSLIELICNFEHLATPDIQIVDSEWRLLRNMLENLPVSCSMKPEVFWNTVSKARQIDNVLVCPNLCEFMLKLLCLPNSTATVEKVIATINKMKTQSKTLSTETLMGLMHTNQVIRYKS